MCLENHAFACGTPTIFVIFIVFTESEQQSPCLLARTQIRDLLRFRQNPLFLPGENGTVY